jgi:hypothetical protein
MLTNSNIVVACALDHHGRDILAQQL